jgi:hypothetical protein
MAILIAFSALKDKGVPLTSNVKFFFEARKKPGHHISARLLI